MDTKLFKNCELLSEFRVSNEQVRRVYDCHLKFQLTENAYIIIVICCLSIALTGFIWVMNRKEVVNEEEDSHYERLTNPADKNFVSV